MIEPAEPASPRLQMENELLNLEVGHLRARLQTYDHLRESEKEAREDLTRTRRRLKELRKKHEETLHDLRRLLRRLNGSPAGPLLRRWKGFGVLLARYGVSSSR